MFGYSVLLIKEKLLRGLFLRISEDIFFLSNFSDFAPKGPLISFGILLMIPYTVQAYYSMFHTARTLIYSKGYREHSHYCLIVSLKTLFVAEKLLDIRLVEAMQMAKTLRENADYASEFSKSSAEVLVEKAQLFLKKTQEILEK